MSYIPFIPKVYNNPDEYFVCSASSLNETEDGLIGPGRTLGMLYEFLGEKLESISGKIAEKVLHRGPQETGKNILAIYDNAITGSWDHKVESWVETPKFHCLGRTKVIRKKCKRLERYVR